MREMQDNDAFEEITSGLQRDMTRLVLALCSEREKEQSKRMATKAEEESHQLQQQKSRFQEKPGQVTASRPPFLTAPYFKRKQREPIFHFTK